MRLPWQLSEENLAIFHDGDSIPTNIDTKLHVAKGDILHFTGTTVAFDYQKNCTRKEIEEGIVYFDCNSATSGFPDFHAVMIDRVKLKDKYKLRVLADQSWDGFFTTQPVKTLAQSSDAVVAINAMKYIPGDCEFNCSGKSISDAYPMNTLIMNNVIMEDHWNITPKGGIRGNEVFVAFGDDGLKSSAIPIKQLSKSEVVDTILEQQDEEDSKSVSACSVYTGYDDYRNCYWAYSTKSLKDKKSLTNEELFTFSSPDILSWAIASSDTILTTGAGGETVCKYKGEDLDEPAAAIGYFDKEIIFITSDLDSTTDRDFDTWYSLCEVFKSRNKATQAVNLDGGCSPQLVINGDLKNGKCSFDTKNYGFGPRYVLNAIGLVPKEKKVSKVFGIYPGTTDINKQEIFLVSGENLPPDLEFRLEGCENIWSWHYGSSSTARQFYCTPTKSGVMNGVVIHAGADVFKKFSVTVVEDKDVSEINVLPDYATLDESTVFTVTGQNLPSDLTLSIDDCGENMFAFAGTPTSALVAATSMDFLDSDDTFTSLQFSCTPSSLGTKAGSVDYGEGTYNFTINVSEDSSYAICTFQDVDQTAFYADEVNAFCSAGIVIGQSVNGKRLFMPAEATNLAETLKVLIYAYDYVTTDDRPKDIEPWYSYYITEARKMGIDVTESMAGDSVLRREVMDYIVKIFYGQTVVDPVQFLVDEGITNGSSPDMPLNRSELVVLAYRAAEKTGTIADIDFSRRTNWDSISSLSLDVPYLDQLDILTIGEAACASASSAMVLAFHGKINNNQQAMIDAAETIFSQTSSVYKGLLGRAGLKNHLEGEWNFSSVNFDA